MKYSRRIVDDDLDELFSGLPALVLEGPKGVGKTETASQRARSIEKLDVESVRVLFAADPSRLARLAPPILLDEWQRFPEVWDLVRREVDCDPSPARFLMTGSATPSERPTHSGAGRIVRVRLRPLSLVERNLTKPTVSLNDLLENSNTPISGTSSVDIVQYAEEIVRSGFPGLRAFEGRQLRAQLDGYLARIVDSELAENGVIVRRPDALRSWLTAYAGATATDCSYNSILDAATPGESAKPSAVTTTRFRDALMRLWLLDPVPGWIPAGNELGRLASAPKHHLADPALACRLLGVSSEALLSSDTSNNRSNGPLLGAMFESLVALCLRVYASRSDASVFHFRTKNGDREVDFVIEGHDRKIVGVEVKLTPTPTDSDVRHLLWLRDRLGDRVKNLCVITTGTEAYRRSDGIAVIPAALLGP
jgi:uncharacterized protein